MPNVKIFVEESLYGDRKERFRTVLAPLRAALCAAFGAPQAVCHLTVVPVLGLTDQASVLVDIHYTAMPDRTPEMVTAAAEGLRDFLAKELGVTPDIRAISLVPETYVALRSS